MSRPFTPRTKRERMPGGSVAVSSGVASIGSSQYYLRTLVCKPAEYRQHQASGADAGVGPRFRQGSELRLRVHDALHDPEQVEGAAREAVNPRHRHHVAGGQLAEHPVKLAAVDVRARHLLAIDVP